MSPEKNHDLGEAHVGAGIIPVYSGLALNYIGKPPTHVLAKFPPFPVFFILIASL